MTTAVKLAQLKVLLNTTDVAQDAALVVYLSLARTEILSWLYSGKIPDGVDDVPARYEPTQIMAVVAGYGLMGAENQTSHAENGISRSFKYSDMLQYIKGNVIPYARVM